MSKEAIKLAIEWIEKQPEEITASKYDVDTRYSVLKELEAELAKQRTWVDLSTIQILDVYAETLKEHRGGSMPDGQIEFAKAIQAKLKDKNI